MSALAFLPTGGEVRWGCQHWPSSPLVGRSGGDVSSGLPPHWWGGQVGMSALATFVDIHGPGSLISRMATPGPVGYGSEPDDRYEGAVRIVGKDGRELVPWRVAVYERGRVTR